MPVVPFIPLIAQGVGMVGGGIMAKKAQSGAMQRSPEEMQALTGAQGIAGAAGKAGQQMLGRGAEALTAPTNYFQTLLRGNRAAMSQAVAGPTAQITDYYRGAERNLSQQGIRGAGRDQAMSELGRSRASQLAGLTTGVQPYAAEQLSGMGTNMMNTGANLTTSAGNLYGNLLGRGFENRTYARGEGQKAGETWGRFFGDVAKTVGKQFGGDEQPSGPPGNPGYGF